MNLLQGTLVTLVLLSALAGQPSGEASPIPELCIQVQAGRVAGTNVGLSTELPYFEQLKGTDLDTLRVDLSPLGSETIAVSGQILADCTERLRLVWIIPSVPADSTTNWVARFQTEGQEVPKGFSWKNEASNFLDLLFRERPLTRYMCARDTSNEQREHETYKVYHHVFGLGGRDFITKGPGGLYTHHRGIFLGWSQLRFEDKPYDFWHMKGVQQVHKGFQQMCSGPVMARSVSEVHWNGPDGNAIVLERRQTTFLRPNADSFLIMDLCSELQAPRGDVTLDGDPEHAGFQFRANNEVAERAQAIAKSKKDGDQAAVESEHQTRYFFHEEGIDPRKDMNLPWVAMTFVAGGKQYYVQHMNHPSNPRPTVYSAYRDYGRFGAFAKAKIAQGDRLKLRYRLVIGECPMPSRETMNSAYSVYADGPVTKIIELEAG